MENNNSRFYVREDIYLSRGTKKYFVWDAHTQSQVDDSQYYYSDAASLSQYYNELHVQGIKIQY